MLIYKDVELIFEQVLQPERWLHINIKIRKKLINVKPIHPLFYSKSKKLKYYANSIHYILCEVINIDNLNKQ